MVYGVGDTYSDLVLVIHVRLVLAISDSKCDMRYEVYAHNRTKRTLQILSSSPFFVINSHSSVILYGVEAEDTIPAHEQRSNRQHAMRQFQICKVFEKRF